MKKLILSAFVLFCGYAASAQYLCQPPLEVHNNSSCDMAIVATAMDQNPPITCAADHTTGVIVVPAGSAYVIDVNDLTTSVNTMNGCFDWYVSSVYDASIFTNSCGTPMDCKNNGNVCQVGNGFVCNQQPYNQSVPMAGCVRMSPNSCNVCPSGTSVQVTYGINSSQTGVKIDIN